MYEKSAGNFFMIRPYVYRISFSNSIYSKSPKQWILQTVNLLPKSASTKILALNDQILKKKLISPIFTSENPLFEKKHRFFVPHWQHRLGPLPACFPCYRRAKKFCVSVGYSGEKQNPFYCFGATLQLLLSACEELL